MCQCQSCAYAALVTVPASLARSGTSDYTVTAVDSVGNDSVQARSVSVTMALANRLLNPGFEFDANSDSRPDSWSSNANFTRSNALARSGNYSGLHFATNNAGDTITQAVTGLTAGTSYTFAGWVDIASTTDAFTLTPRVQWGNANNTVLRTNTIKAYTGSTAGWGKPRSAALAPSGTTDAQADGAQQPRCHHLRRCLRPALICMQSYFDGLTFRTLLIQ